MKTIFDYAATNQMFDAACPQRPSWQISPVGYEWARAVLMDRTHKAVISRKDKPNRYSLFGMFWHVKEALDNIQEFIQHS